MLLAMPWLAAATDSLEDRTTTATGMSEDEIGELSEETVSRTAQHQSVQAPSAWQIHTVDGDAACVDIVKTRDELNQR